MTTDTQQFIDNIVQAISIAEDAESVTNEQVGRVFAFLCSRIKEIQSTIDNAPSVADEAAKRMSADKQLAARIDALLSDDASDAIDNFIEIKQFLATFKDSDSLAEMLGELRTSLTTLRQNLTKQTSAIEKLTPIRIESDEALEAMRLLGLLKEGQMYYIPEEE